MDLSILFLERSEERGVIASRVQDERSPCRGGSPESMRGTCLRQRTTRTPEPTPATRVSSSAWRGARSTSSARRGEVRGGAGSAAGATIEMRGAERTNARPASRAGTSSTLEVPAARTGAPPRGNASVNTTRHAAAKSHARALFTAKSRALRMRQCKRGASRRQARRARDPPTCSRNSAPRRTRPRHARIVRGAVRHLVLLVGRESMLDGSRRDERRAHGAARVAISRTSTRRKPFGKRRR